MTLGALGQSGCALFSFWRVTTCQREARPAASAPITSSTSSRSCWTFSPDLDPAPEERDSQKYRIPLGFGSAIAGHSVQCGAIQSQPCYRYTIPQNQGDCIRREEEAATIDDARDTD